GGLAHTHGPDLEENRRFLQALRRLRPSLRFGRVLDCGAGVGRVSKFLAPHFQSLHLLEPCARLRAIARQRLKHLKGKKGLRFIGKPLQEFTPQKDLYDVIWLQWVLLHLTDDDVVAFLARCRDRLRPNGVIVIKD
ncbi:unnamed protein product, partial [Effrenium voratum]